MRELLDTTSRKAPCPACGASEIVPGFGPVCAICGSQLIEREPRPGDSYLKHIGSWLLDLPVRVEYDDETRTVTLAAEEFDSALISDFVIRGLTPAGVVAFTDETGEIASPQAPWNLVFELAGVPYRLEVVRQRIYGSGGKNRVAARLIRVEKTQKILKKSGKL